MVLMWRLKGYVHTLLHTVVVAAVVRVISQLQLLGFIVAVNVSTV